MHVFYESNLFMYSCSLFCFNFSNKNISNLYNFDYDSGDAILILNSLSIFFPLKRN